MKARILFLAAALALAALPVRAQTELQELVAAAFEAEAAAWEAQGLETLALGRKDYASVALKSDDYALKWALRWGDKASFAQKQVSLGLLGWETVVTAWNAVSEEARQAKAERERIWQAAEAERERQPHRIREAVSRAYYAEARAWDSEADFDFVKYDGFDGDKKARAEQARNSAGLASPDGIVGDEELRALGLQTGGSFAREQASRANLHALRARENASDWRRRAGRETGGLKELANKAAEAWESAAQAWEAAGE